MTDSVNLITDAISIALNGEFGDGYTNYTENVKQGLKEPCFFIFCINPTHELFLGKRYFRENQFCIQFFPADKQNMNSECHAAAERLEFCLEWITVTGDLVHGTKMKYEIVDGVLNFFVNYDMFVYRRSESQPMEEISQDVTVKG